MAWASANKVIISAGAAQKLSREDVADILHRYAAYKGYSTAASGDLSRFPDAANVKSAQAMTWAVGTGIINGSNGKLLAQDNATRAQVATILMNFCNQVAK